MLDPVEPFGQDLSDLVELAAQWSRVIGYAHARRADAVAALVTGFLDDLGTGTATLAATTELAMRLGVTRQSAAKVVSTALAISGPLAATGQALANGHLDARKAEMIATALEHQPYPVCEAVQDAVLPTAAGRTHPQLAQDLTKALIAADHHAAQARHRTARDGRRVNHPRHLPDGMASIFAVLPAPDALALDLALDAAARSAKAGGDGRTLDQLRADILAAIGADALIQGGFGAPTPARTPIPVPPAPPVDTPIRRPAPDPSDQHLDREAAETTDPAPDEPAAPPVNAPVDAVGPADAPDDADLPAPPTGPPPDQRPDADGVPDAVPPPDVDNVPDAIPRDADAPPSAPAPPDTTDPPGSVDPPGTDPPPPRAWIPLGLLGGVPVRVNVTVPMATLLGGDEPGTLHGYGPIDPATARALALGGTWRRLVTDPLSGTVLDLGRTRYRPPTDLAELIRARDKTCFRPGCGAHADGCHLDHTIPAAHGGPTADTNLAPACTTDHTLKTLGDFYVRQIHPGVFDWLSRRTARTYRREADGTTTPIHPRTGQSLTSSTWTPDYANDEPPPF
ncbi:DUF222 domain-containing protein [Georgenia yuyongxinii]|uniref:HNH endonuclease signature motif containing protein n=1 Tax=Georgenia yuyongxinii TaxID=2589797 RepID=UPI00143D466C|nr:HNH endonuclease signature motif containing protein [Georgenia yuyongxinii]